MSDNKIDPNTPKSTQGMNTPHAPTEVASARSELALYNRITQVFFTIPDEEIYGEVLGIVREALESPHGVFGYIADNGDLVIPSMTREIWKECQVPDKSIVFPPNTWGDSLWGRAIRDRRPYYANRDFHVPAGHIPVASFLTIPVVYQDRTIGLISVGNRPGGYSESHQRLLENITHFISPILHARQQRDRHERDHRKIEEALRREHIFKTSVIEGVTEGLCVCHEITEYPFVQFTIWNARMEDITGYTMEQINRLGWYQSVYPDPQLQARAIERMQRMRAGDNLQSEMWEITRADGTKRTISISTAVISSADHEHHVLALMSDITEQLKAEETRAKAVSLYQDLVETSQDLIWQCDAERRYIYLNPAWESMFGYRLDEMLGRRFTDFQSPENAERDSKEFTRLLYGGSVKGYEMIHKRKDGSDIHLVFNAKFVTDAGGNFIGTRGTAQDITERKRVETALRESEDRYRNIAHHLPMGMHLYELQSDNRLVFLGANRAADQILNVDNSQFIGKTIEEAFPPLAQTEVPERYRIAARDGVAWHTEQIDYCDGVIHGAYEVQAFQTSPNRMAAVFVDITERLRAEAEKEKLQAQLLQAQKIEAVGRLAGGVAHDFNNMLQVILGHLDLVLSEVPPAGSLRESLDEIQKSALRSADLTRQLLAFARKQTVCPQVLDINDMVSGMLKMLQRLIGENIKLCWVPAGDHWFVKMDPSQMDQIMANLAVNARDAIKGVGQITIETANMIFDDTYVHRHPECVPGDYMMLSFSDSGQGMDEETKAHLFEPFFTTKELGRGTGLGLATVFGIVKQNHGFINVYSEVGRGTTFKLYFPRVHAEAEVAEPPAAQRLMCGTETVLLVEDEEQILSLGQRVLEQHGYTVLTAHNPEAALELAAKCAGPIHLLITDVVMPGMTGKELKQQLLIKYPDMKCLFMSGYTANVIAHHGVLDEGVHFLQKPFTVRTLADRVRAVLEK